MKALAKDPLKRHQSMEELPEELQRCYGSVRYRRSMEQQNAARPPPPRPAPVRSRAAAQASGTIHTPPWHAAARPTAPTRAPPSGPILLTRRKERRKTLPMELPAAHAVDQRPRRRS